MRSTFISSKYMRPGKIMNWSSMQQLLTFIKNFKEVILSETEKMRKSTGNIINIATLGLEVSPRCSEARWWLIEGEWWGTHPEGQCWTWAAITGIHERNSLGFRFNRLKFWSVGNKWRHLWEKRTEGLIGLAILSAPIIFLFKKNIMITTLTFLSSKTIEELNKQN